MADPYIPEIGPANLKSASETPLAPLTSSTDGAASAATATDPAPPEERAPSPQVWDSNSSNSDSSGPTKYDDIDDYDYRIQQATALQAQTIRTSGRDVGYNPIEPEASGAAEIPALRNSSPSPNASPTPSPSPSANSLPNSRDSSPSHPHAEAPVISSQPRHRSQTKSSNRKSAKISRGSNTPYEDPRDLIHRSPGRSVARSRQTISGSPPAVAAPLVSYVLPYIDHHYLGKDMVGEPLVRDWNKEHQECLGMSAKTPQEELKKQTAIAKLANDFLYAAKTYGKIIINELERKGAKKTIEPILKGGRSPGLAGGMKYFAAGILFKFSTDTLLPDQSMYMYSRTGEPNPHWAMKASGHDIKGLIAVMNTRDKVPGLHLPLQALITYRGHRLLAMPILPIAGAGQDKSLCYGSEDGGRSFYCNNSDVNEIMKLLGKTLNLAPHRPPDNILLNGQPTLGELPANNYLCTDIEGHMGKDKRIYALDLARIFPPDNLDFKQARYKTTDGWKFFQLFRPEFILSYSGPRLSSDAYSNFTARAERATVEEAANRASEHLDRVTIPQFSATYSNYHAYQLKDISVDVEAHRAGINIRHLGRVRTWVTSVPGKAYILMEIVARTVKNQLREKLRENLKADRGLPVFESPRKVIVDYFNQLLEDVDYWSNPNKLKKECSSYFTFATGYERAQHEGTVLPDLIAYPKDDGDLRKSLYVGGLDLSTFFTRLCNLSGIKLDDYSRQSLEEESKAGKALTTSFRFDIDHVHMNAVVKHIYLVEFAKARILMLSLGNRSQHTNQLKQTLKDANSLFAKAHSANTANTTVLFEWAKCNIETVDRLSLTGEEAIQTLNFARRLLETCVRLLNQFGSFDADAIVTYVSVLIRLSTLSRDHDQIQQYQLEARTYKGEEAGEARKQVSSFRPTSAPKVLVLTRLVAESHLTKSLSSSASNLVKQPLIAKIIKAATNAWELLPSELFLEEPVESFALQFLHIDKMEGGVNRVKEDKIRAVDAAFATALRWHRIALSINSTPYTLLHTADILRRWGVFRWRFQVELKNEAPAAELFARSAEFFKMSFHFSLSFSDGTWNYNITPDDTTKPDAPKVPLPSGPQPLGLSVLHCWPETAVSQIRDVLFSEVKVSESLCWIFEADAGKIDLRELCLTIDSTSKKDLAKLYVFGWNPPSNHTNDLHPVEVFKSKVWEDPSSDSLSQKCLTKFILGAKDGLVQSAPISTQANLYRYFCIKIVPMTSIGFNIKSMQLVGYIDVPLLPLLPQFVTVSSYSTSSHQNHPSVVHARPLEAAFADNTNVITFVRTAQHSTFLTDFIRTFLEFRATRPKRKKGDEGLKSSIDKPVMVEIFQSPPLIQEDFTFANWLRLRPIETSGIRRYPAVFTSSRSHQHHQLVQITLNPERISLREAQNFFPGTEFITQLRFGIKALDLRGVTGLTNESLLAVLRQLKVTLRSLNLSNTSLGSASLIRSLASDGVKIVNLRVRADVAQDEIVQLAKSRQQLGLQYLDLSGAFLGRTSLQAVTSQSWTGLTLNQCTLKKPAMLGSLPCDKLMALSLSRMDAPEEGGLDVIFRRLETANKLAYLDVSHSNITIKSVLQIAKLDTLQTLNVEGCTALLGSDLAHLTSLTNLTEANVRTKRGIGAQNPFRLPSAVLFQLSQSWRRLTVLQLGMWFEYEDRALAKIIFVNAATLRYVDIRGSKSAASETASSLEKCASLLVLQLEGCELLGPHITGILRHCPRLQRVGLSGITVTDDQLKPLLGNQRSWLHTLTLSGGNVTNATLKLLAGYHSDSIRILTLTHCSSSTLLRYALPEHADEVGPKVTADAVLQLAQQCANLQFLDLSRCTKLQETDIDHIRQQLPDTIVSPRGKTALDSPRR